VVRLSLEEPPSLDEPPPEPEPDPPLDESAPLVGDSPLLLDESLAEPPDALSEPPPSALLAVLAESRDLDLAAAPRSFLAQPLPLKWIVGGAKALRTGEAPQMGHAVGPSAVTEWTTSKRWPFGQM
jgi:hypothetical protein